MQRPKSGLIKEVDYDEATRVLDITLTNGKRYQYKDVPREHYRNITNAESPGRYFNENIKKYQAEHIIEEETS